jgi:hypothetical protein
MSSNSTPNKRGKTTVHSLKATPKSMRPVQPPHVYDNHASDNNDAAEERHQRREERRARRGSAAADFSTYGIYAGLFLLGMGVLFYLVQGGASTVPIDRSGDTWEEIRAQNEETRRLNAQKLSELPPPPVQRTVEPNTSAPARTPSEPASNAAQPSVSVQKSENSKLFIPPRPTPLGGISAGMLQQDQGKSPPNATEGAAKSDVNQPDK